jgi:TorA maturation chaperone TorD
LTPDVEAQLRAGRAALLDLLASLFLRELDAGTAALLAADPALADALRPPADEEGLRALRVEYSRLLLMEVPPYASIYLDAPPVIGGEAGQRLEALLAAAGRPLASLERAAGADHAGLYLRALATAERAGDVAPLLGEALGWLPQCLTALARADADGWYGGLATLTAHALRECARAAPVAPAGLDVRRDEAPTAPEDDSLRAIARWLSTPAWSGWFLSRHDLRALAAPFGAPTGIVERERMLEQVFEASALDERTPELLEALLALLAGWRTASEEWRIALPPAWSGVLAPWHSGLDHTHALLSSMRSALA